MTMDKRLRQAIAGHAANSSAAGSWVGSMGSAASQLQAHSWRLDKDDVASVFVRLRRNLMGE